MVLARRGFLLGLFAAPAIVRASSLMPVKLFEPEIPWGMRGMPEIFRGGTWPSLSEIVRVTLRNRTGEIAEMSIRDNALIERLGLQ
jgi:hypothetical protein